MRNVWVAGATGLIGRELVVRLLAETAAEIHLFVRRAPDLQSPRLHVHVVDLMQPESWPQPPCDVAFNALGTTIRQAGSQAAFRAVDQDAVLNFARAAARAGASRFISVSAIGASPGALSFYSRVKGEVEQALADIGFAHLVLMQPSLLLGDRQEHRTGEQAATWLMRPLSPLMRGPLSAYRPVAGSDVAAAMVRVAGKPLRSPILRQRHDDIMALADTPA